MEDDFFEEYDELAILVEKSGYRHFKQSLKRWHDFLTVYSSPSVTGYILRLRSEINIKEHDADIFKEPSSMVGSALIQWPDRKEDRLSAQLQVIEKLLEPDVKPEGFAFMYFNSGNRFDDNINKMSEQFFHPFQRELRREIKKIFASSSIDVPASDRTVSINHNTPEYQELDKRLEELEKTLKTVNSGDVGAKEQAISEVGAMRRIWQAMTVRSTVLKTLFLGGLVWISTVFAETVAGQICTAAIELLKVMFGYIF
ncbi:hypothetical protein [Bartonella sp. LJL80]